MEREALKLALEALDMERLHYLAHESGNDAPEYILEAIASCEQALAQQAQGPVCPECKAGVLYECIACSSNNYPPKPAQEPVQVSVEEFVHVVEDKEHLVGRPIVWAQWPSKEKNNG